MVMAERFTQDQGEGNTTITIVEERYMYQKTKAASLLITFVLLTNSSHVIGQNIPNLQCVVSGKIVAVGMGSEQYRERIITVEFEKQTIFVKGIPEFTMFADLNNSDTRIYGKYEGELEGNKYRRIVDISRESGRIIMHTDDTSKKGERFIGELNGNCEKLKGRKF